MILLEGIIKDLDNGLKRLLEKYGISIVVIEDVNWNDDLALWPAEGVFKKSKPFGGKAASFLDNRENPGFCYIRVSRRDTFFTDYESAETSV